MPYLITTGLAAFSGLVGWVFGGRRRNTAQVVGMELSNEGTAIRLYGEMGEIAEGMQRQLVAALEEVDRFRTELNACTDARIAAVRDKALLEQQMNIDRVRNEAARSVLRVELAEQRKQIVELQTRWRSEGTPTAPVVAETNGQGDMHETTIVD